MFGWLNHAILLGSLQLLSDGVHLEDDGLKVWSSMKGHR